MSSLILQDRKDEGILILTLNRPEAANALSKATLDQFNQIIDDIQLDESIRCVIITGAGIKAFSAGADLKERQGMNETEVVQAVTYIGDTIN